MQTIIDYLWTLGPWNWFIAAVALFILETIVPGVHFLWFGVAAILVGVLGLATGIGLPMQLVAFAVISCIAVLLFRRLVKPDAVGSDEPDLNFRSQQYIGRVVTVEVPIVSGRGKVRVGDTLWAAQGSDSDVGTAVKIVGATGTVLLVEKV